MKGLNTHSDKRRKNCPERSFKRSRANQNFYFMKKLFYGVMCFALIGVGLVGCKKEKKIKSSDEDSIVSKIETIKFTTEQEMITQFETIKKMGESERREFEKKNNYKSLFTSVYEVYEGINLDNLKHQKELIQYVNENSDKLELTEDKNGELEYKPIYADNPFSLIAGKNRMIIIGSKCVKIFDDGLITAPLNMFNDLNVIDDKKISSVSVKNGFEVVVFKFNDTNIKAICGSEAEARSDDGRDRTRIRLILTEALVNTSSGQTWSSNPWYEVRPFMRTLGIWYHAQRTISGGISSNLGYDSFNGTPVIIPFNRTISPSLSYVQTVSSYIPTVDGNLPNNLRFLNYNAWGDTPSTGTASMSCN